MSARAGAAVRSPGSRQRFGVVLGAGGVLGAAWTVGALAALQSTLGVDPRDAEVLVGTSAGSVLAAFLGCQVPVETLVDHQRGVSGGEDPFGYDYDRDTGGALPPLPRLRLGSRPLLVSTALHPRRVTPLTALAAVLPEGRGSIAPVGQLVDSVAPAGPLAWAGHPATWVVAMDYRTGRRVPFGRPGTPPARLSDAVMASCAIPGWYAPVSIGGRPYVDGGTCSATSVDLVAGRGLDTVYVLSPMTSLELDAPASVAARLERHLRRMVTRRLLREAATVRATGTAVVLVCPGPRDLELIGANLMDPRRRLEVFETSLSTSAATLRAHAAGLPAAG